MRLRGPFASAWKLSPSCRQRQISTEALGLVLNSVPSTESRAALRPLKSSSGGMALGRSLNISSYVTGGLMRSWRGKENIYAMLRSVHDMEHTSNK